MSGDGLGSPPWGPADPAPELEGTQAIPGLGSVPGPARSAGGAQSGREHRHGNGYGDAFRAAGGGGPGAPEDGAPTANGQDTHDPAGSEEADADGSGGGTGAEQDPPGEAQHGKGDDGDGKRRPSFWRELPILLVVALVLALIIKAFVAQAFYIPSGSMENTLEINDRVLINKIVYHLRPIHRGDIVVFDGTGSWNPGTPSGSPNIFAKALDEVEGLVGVTHDPNIYIKRVIGLPGDHVACCNAQGDVTVNGVALHESSYLYPGNQPSSQSFSITVPSGRLWVMGDHRQISDDSRGHLGDPGGGTIPESGVLGRAFVIIWPPSRWRILNIPATFEQPRLNASNPAPGNAAAAAASTATLDAALLNGTPLQQTATPVPLVLGFIGAVPLTWLQRKLRTRRRRPRRR
ncbi:MAG TPA: signal peptidase I [Trebonia sp.]|nr:signal peptidase I [Trebonia sp.]